MGLYGQMALRHTADALTASLGATRADAQHLAGTSCKNCEIYASCCQTPALMPEWRLALAPRLPQASFPETATPFASATEHDGEVWRRANAAVGQHQRGHADILAQEAAQAQLLVAGQPNGAAGPTLGLR